MVFEFLDKFTPSEFIGLVALLIAPIVIVAAQWRRVRIAEMEGALKQQMLDKGMTAEQIELVLHAGLDSSGKSVTLTGNEKLDKDPGRIR